LALAAVSFLLGAVGRPRRPLRHAAHHPDWHGPVHDLFARLGRAVPHRYTGDVARGGAARHTRIRRRVLAPFRAAPDPRHRRHGEPPERGAPVRHGALPRTAARTGSGWGFPARARAGARPLAERADLPPARVVAVEGALRAALQERRARAGACGEG